MEKGRKTGIKNNHQELFWSLKMCSSTDSRDPKSTIPKNSYKTTPRHVVFKIVRSKGRLKEMREKSLNIREIS